MKCEAYQDLVAAHVDGVLSAAEHQDVAHHLGTCERCRKLFAEASRFHSAFTARRFIVPVPAEVEQRLRVALATENSQPTSLRARLSAFLSPPRFVVSLAAAGLLLAILLPRLFSSTPQPSAFTQAVEYYQAATAGQMPLAYRSADPQAIEVALNTSGQLDFATHVLDLRPAGYRVVGGYIGGSAQHPVAVVLYEGNEGPIVCLRQRGVVPPKPPGSEGTEEKYLYRHAGYTVSFVQYPEHFCMLISRLPKEVFLRSLARLPAT